MFDMVRSYPLRDVLESPDFRVLTETVFRPVAWGIVYGFRDPAQRLAVYSSPMPLVEDTALLVGERYKKSDPERQGKLVVPGGGVKKRDGGVKEAAKREVTEEACLDTREANYWSLKEWDHVPCPVAFRRDGLAGLFIPRISANPLIVIRYDDGKAYSCDPVDLRPIVETDEPRENPESDVRNPRFMPLAKAFAEKDKFTGAVHFLLDMTETRGRPVEDRFGQDDVVLVSATDDIYRYLKFAEPEND